MPVRPKLWVVALFALRLLVIPPTLTRLRYIRVSWRSEDWSYARINVQIITQVVLHLSVILATVPCMKSLLVAFRNGHHPPPRTQSRVSYETAGTTSILPLARPPLDSARRAKSAFDLRHEHHDLLEIEDKDFPLPTSVSADAPVRPGPQHRQRMKSWTLPPSGGTVGDGIGPVTQAQNLATAEYDAQHARTAELERRGSRDSGKIHWSRAFQVESDDRVARKTSAWTLRDFA